MKKIIVILLTLMLVGSTGFRTHAYELVNDPTITQSQVIACLKHYNASDKIINAVPFVYEYAQKVGIDPGIVMAMSTIETGWGKSRLFRYNNNPGGLKAKRGWGKFSSVEEGYTRMINLLATYAGLMNKDSYLYGYSTTTEGLAGMYWTNYGNDYGYHNQLTSMVKMMQSFPKGEEDEPNPEKDVTKTKTQEKKSRPKSKKKSSSSAVDKIYEILNRKKPKSSALDIIYHILNR